MTAESTATPSIRCIPFFNYPRTYASEEQEILEGTLHCPHCRHTYEIRDGIPDLLPPDFR